MFFEGILNALEWSKIVNLGNYFTVVKFSTDGKYIAAYSFSSSNNDGICVFNSSDGTLLSAI